MDYKGSLEARVKEAGGESLEVVGDGLLHVSADFPVFLATLLELDVGHDLLEDVLVELLPHALHVGTPLQELQAVLHVYPVINTPTSLTILELLLADHALQLLLVDRAHTQRFQQRVVSPDVTLDLAARRHLPRLLNRSVLRPRIPNWLEERQLLGNVKVLPLQRLLHANHLQRPHLLSHRLLLPRTLTLFLLLLRHLAEQIHYIPAYLAV